MKFTFVSNILVVLLLTGCEKSKSTNDSKSAASNSDAPSGPVFKSGYASGKITRPDGKPIGIPGVTYDLYIHGISGAAEKVSYSPKPNPDGTWSTKLVGGIYHAPQCSAKIPFAGGTYTYHLIPTADLGDIDAEKGMVADFTWKMTGPCNNDGQRPDPANATHWIGGSCSLIWDRNYSDAAGKVLSNIPSDGAILRFTAVPKGKAIDGSDPKPIVWDRGYDTLLSSVKPSALNDMPPTEGGWTISGKEVLPNKTEKPLLLTISTERKFAPTVDITLSPARISLLSSAADGPTLLVMPAH
jgi:hypothetical protein